MNTNTSSPFVDNKESQASQTKNHYHHALVEVAVTLIAQRACQGWTPEDLRHEFTTQIDPLLFNSLSTVTNTAPHVMVSRWVRETRPGRVSTIGIAALEKIVSALERLPSLDEWNLLSADDLQDQETALLAGLTSAQRKAHYRIQRLLKKAESTTFEKEADALIHKAEALRQQYRIEMLLSDSYSSGTQPDNSVTGTRVRLRAPWIRHQLRLLATVARVNSCETLLLTPSGIATVIGAPDDVTHVVDLFSSLNRQRDHFMKTSAGAREAQDTGETSSYRRSFMLAYTDRIGTLLRRAAEEVITNLADSAPSAPEAIVPALRERSLRARNTLDSLFPHTRRMTFTAHHSKGFRDGRDAAEHSHLGGDSSGLTGQRSLPSGSEKNAFPA